MVPSSVLCRHIVARLYFRLLAGCVVSFVCSLLAHSCEVSLLVGCVVHLSVLRWHIVTRLHFRLLAGCVIPPSVLCWHIVARLYFRLLAGCPFTTPLFTG